MLPTILGGTICCTQFTNSSANLFQNRPRRHAQKQPLNQIFGHPWPVKSFTARSRGTLGFERQEAGPQERGAASEVEFWSQKWEARAQEQDGSRLSDSGYKAEETGRRGKAMCP